LVNWNTYAKMFDYLPPIKFYENEKYAYQI